MKLPIITCMHVFCISLALLVAQEKSKPINPGKPLDVCSVLQSLELYKGNIIEVRGEWRGLYLTANCSKSFMTGDHKWPDTILLDNPSVIEDGTLISSWPNWREERRAAYEKADMLADPMFATIVGRLEVKEEMLRRDSNGKTHYEMWSGYGHLNNFPARIVQLSIKDLTGKPSGRPRERKSLE
jgi:hypothetical protein